MICRASLAPFSAFLAAVALLAGCRSAPPLAAYARLDVSSPPGATVTLGRDAWASVLGDVRPGDIIMGGKHDPTSMLIRLSADDYSFHTHSGIIDVRDGRVVVSHATGRFDLWRTSPRLLGKVIGSVRADDLDTFVREYADVRIVRLPEEAKNRRLAELTRACERSGIAFDPFFDTDDPTSLHCSEYTARALATVGYGGHYQIVGRTPNRSMAALLTKVGITTRRFIRVDGFGDGPGATTIARLSRLEKLESALAVEEAFAALHGRVTADPALSVSDVVSCDASRLLHFTPTADAYLRAVTGLAQAHPSRDRAEIRRRSELVLDLVADQTGRARLAGATNP